MAVLTPVERLILLDLLVLMRSSERVNYTDGMATMIQTTEAVLNSRKISEEDGRKLVQAFRS